MMRFVPMIRVALFAVAIGAGTSISRGDDSILTGRRETNLKNLVGDAEYSRMMAEIRAVEFGLRPSYAQDWLKTVQNSEHLSRVVSFLQSPNSELRQLSADALLRIWENEPQLAKNLDDETRSKIVAGLGEYGGDLGSGGRKRALEIVSALGPDEPTIAPLVLHSLIDQEFAVRALAVDAADHLFTAKHDVPKIAAEVLGEIKVDRSPELIKVAKGRLANMGDAVKATGVEAAIYRIEHDEKTIEVARETGHFTPEKPKPYRIELDPLLLAEDRSAANFRALQLLCGEDEKLRKDVASFITTQPARFDRLEILGRAVAAGYILSPDVLARLALSPKAVCVQMARLLEKQETPVVLAALQTVKAIGVEGDEIQAALARLLNDPNDHMRYSAAELLGRKDILAQAALPGLLVDLKDASPNTRAIAARQLDELKVAPPQITSALVRAVDRRDLVVRQGLVNALESAYVSRGNALDALKATAGGSDPALGPYARAALREVESINGQRGNGK
jgi:hypothetical protein